MIRVDENDVILIDSGAHRGVGEHVLEVLNAQGWHLRAIFNTHFHADHVGANRYLQEETGCRIYTSDAELSFVRFPYLENTTLFGSYPLHDLADQFLLAEASDAELLTPDVLPKGMEIIPLPGHSFEMVGFRTADGNVFLGDALASEKSLRKYAVGFLWDVKGFLAALEGIRDSKAAHYIPAHGPVKEEIAELAQANIDNVLAIADTIASLCEPPQIFEMLLKRVFEHYCIPISLLQYALIGSTIRSYLSYLEELGRVTYFFEDNQMYWTNCVKEKEAEE